MNRIPIYKEVNVHTITDERNYGSDSLPMAALTINGFPPINQKFIPVGQNIQAVPAYLSAPTPSDGLFRAWFGIQLSLKKVESPKTT